MTAGEKNQPDSSLLRFTSQQTIFCIVSLESIPIENSLY